MECLPLTCAHPVIPGRTVCRLRCSVLNKGRYSIGNGLGPMRDMSPFSTFHNWGNSSSDVKRNTSPRQNRLFSKEDPLGFKVLNFINLNDLSSLPILS